MSQINPNLKAPLMNPYIRLMRLNKPVGIFLLLAPTYWALWMAAAGTPSIKNLVVFTLGVLIMRSAGCIINDLADRDLDRQVKRTQDRPLATGELQPRQAINLLGVLLLSALFLVALTNQLTFQLSLLAVFLAAIYPIMKRYTHLPQLVLGAAFGMSIPMAFAAEINLIPKIAWLLFFANLAWVVAYDTQYAMADREDDKKIGIKSTAILLGDTDIFAILFLQMIFLVALGFVGAYLQLKWPWWVALGFSAMFFGHQWVLTRDRIPASCTQAFINNQWVGLVIWLGLVAALAIH